MRVSGGFSSIIPTFRMLPCLPAITPVIWCRMPGPIPATTSSPTLCANLFDLVFAENLGPLALRAQNHLADLADSPGAAWNRGHVVRRALHFLARIRRSDRQTDAAHNDNVGQIVADVGGVFRGDAALRQNFLQDRDLFDMSLIDICHFHLSRALFPGRRNAPADHPGRDLVPVQPLQRDAVLRIEALGLHHLSLGTRDIIKTAVGEHSVDVHQQQFYARNALFELGRHYVRGTLFGSRSHVRSILKKDPGAARAGVRRAPRRRIADRDAAGTPRRWTPAERWQRRSCRRFQAPTTPRRVQRVPALCRWSRAVPARPPSFVSTPPN